MTPFGGALSMVEDAVNHRLYCRIKVMSDVGEVDKYEYACFGCEIKKESNMWALRINAWFWGKCTSTSSGWGCPGVRKHDGISRVEERLVLRLRSAYPSRLRNNIGDESLTIRYYCLRT